MTQGSPFALCVSLESIQILGEQRIVQVAFPVHKLRTLDYLFVFNRNRGSFQNSWKATTCVSCDPGTYANITQ